jgi:hypothetical protein
LTGRHRKSVHRDDIEQHNAAFVDGICHALDELHAMGATAIATRLERRLFAPADGEARPEASDRP